MGLALIPVLLAVELGGGFGAATATVISTTDESLLVEIHVEVAAAADTVVVHLVLPGEEPTTLPMLPRPEGGYGITTELRRADYQVVFETVGSVAVQSRAVALSALGVDVLPEPAPDRLDGEDAADSGWIWLAVAFAAASLSALALWVLGGEQSGDPIGHVDQEEGSEAATPSP